MKLRKVTALALVAAMAMSMVACGNSDGADTSTDANNTVATGTESGSSDVAGTLSYADITLGEDYTDITTTIHVFNQRTDMAEAEYNGKNWDAYLADFNAMYPNITVE